VLILWECLVYGSELITRSFLHLDYTLVTQCALPSTRQSLDNHFYPIAPISGAISDTIECSKWFWSIYFIMADYDGSVSRLNYTKTI
jgi:hypothetical protein